MGASKSKPYTREAARTVLARRQQMVQGEPTQPAAQQQAAQTAASSATVPPVQQAVTAEHSRPVAPVQPQEVAMPISRSGYDNAEALNPDILREVSKWAVVRTEGKNAVDFNSHKKSTTQIRFELDGGKNQGKDATSGKLTEMQIHELFKTIRDNNSVSAAVLATTFSLDEAVVSNIMKSARLPVIVKDEEDPDSSIAI